MKFAHISDCHLGVWNNHPNLNGKPMEAFREAIDISIREEIDFLLISGDIFNTNLPDIETLKNTIGNLKRLHKKDIPVFAIPGSHDFSPSGKTMISVLEKAGLLKDVSLNKNSDLIQYQDMEIIGIQGKTGGLEKSMYKEIRKWKSGKKYRIFMFHSAITEFKPPNLKQMNSIDFKDFPQNFDYYAGGHVHKKSLKKQKEKIIAFPGKLFPTNFKELETNQDNGIFIVNTEKREVNYKNINKVKTLSLEIDAHGKTGEDIEKEIIEKLKKSKIQEKVVCLRIKGIMEEGKPSDINFRNIKEKFSSALTLEINTRKLGSKEFNEITHEPQKNREDLVEEIISKNIGQFKTNFENEKDLVKNLMEKLNTKKRDSETNDQFKDRVNKICKEVLKIK